MTEMTNPHNALLSYQDVYANGHIDPHPCDLHPELAVLMDDANGSPRVTYSLIESGVVQAIVIYIAGTCVDGIPCFDLGYAVAQNFRCQGIASEVLQKSVAEMRNGLWQCMRKFYIRAVIGTSNIASQRVARHIFKSCPEQTTDGVSGQPALAYLKLVEC